LNTFAEEIDVDANGNLAVAGTISSTGAIIGGNIELSGILRGPSSFTIDPAAHGDNTGTVIIAGNLQVDGVTTTVNSTTVSIDDKNLVLADNATTAVEANGAGITIGGASATLTYNSSDDSWVFNKAPYYSTNRVLTTADTGSGNGLNADLWDGNQFATYLNQAVLTSSSPTFAGVTVGNVVVGTNDIQILSNIVWHAGNDGAGSGLDADLLDGQQGSYYLDYNNFTNTPDISTYATQAYAQQQANDAAVAMAIALG
jgi:hypothetical protein